MPAEIPNSIGQRLRRREEELRLARNRREELHAAQEHEWQETEDAQAQQAGALRAWGALGASRAVRDLACG